MRAGPPAAAQLGRHDRRRRARAGRPLPAARLAARRGPLGDRPGADVGGHASRRTRSSASACRCTRRRDGEHRRARHEPRAASTSTASRAATRRRFASCAPTTASRTRWRRFTAPAGAHRLMLGRAGRRQAGAAGHLPRPGPTVRDRAGNVAVTPRRARGGRHPRPPGPDRARARRPAAAAAGHGGREGEVLRRRARAGYRWSVRRVGDPQVRRHGVARDPRPGVPARRRAPPASTCSRCAPGAGTRPVPFLVQAHEAREDPRRRPDDHLARHRRGRRPAVRRPAEHAHRRRRRCTGRACSTTGCRRASPTTSRRCSSSSTATGSATTSRATSTSTCRATRAPATATACCWPARERWVTRPLARRLRRYVLRRRQARVRSAPTRCAAACAVTRARATPARCSRPDAADGHRPVRRAAGEAAHARRARHADPDRRRRPSYGLMTGVPQLPGFTRARGVLARAAGATQAAGRRRPGADRRRGGRGRAARGKPARELRSALTADAAGQGHS